MMADDGTVSDYGKPLKLEREGSMRNPSFIIEYSSFACLRATHRQTEGAPEGLGYGK